MPILTQPLNPEIVNPGLVLDLTRPASKSVSTFAESRPLESGAKVLHVLAFRI